MSMTITFELQPIAKWESKSGKHWIKLFSDGVSAWYQGNGCGGSLGKIDEGAAIAEMQTQVDSGRFLPDNAKTPMKRVA